MKTPHAILIGLSLIAAAIYFKDTAVEPAHAYGITASKEDVKNVIEGCLDKAQIIESGSGYSPSSVRLKFGRTAKYHGSVYTKC